MRLLLITNVFPNPVQPTRGIFNFEMVRGLSAAHHVEVVSPISWIDAWMAKRQACGSAGFESLQRALEGVSVHYPRYYYTPRTLRSWYGAFMWHSASGTILPLLRADSPDAILAYWAYPDGYVALRAARRLSRPCIVMVGGSDVLLLTKQAARRRQITEVLQRADAIVAVSENIKAKVSQLGVAPSKVHVVYRGVDEQRFVPGARAEARRRLGLPADRPLLLWVGRMVPVKGLEVLIDACALLKARRTDFHLVLAGSGPLERELKVTCLTRNLQRHVSFIGLVLPAHLPDWYRAADVTVMPSHSEGVPNVLLESIACGTPFVASCVGGIPEIASPGIDQLVAAGNAAELADALERQLASTTLGVERRFCPQSWTAAARQLIDVIEPLTAVPATYTRLRTPGEIAAAKFNVAVSPWSWRQMARRILSVSLPKRLLVTHRPIAGPWVWLTFDDGPDPQCTPRLLDMLRAHDVRATFFVIGSKAEQRPDLVRRMASEGHHVGNHTYSHQPIDQLSHGALLQEVRRTGALLQRLLGKPSSLFRPPHGKVTPSSLWQLWRAEQQVILWNANPRDYLAGDAKELVRWFRANPLDAGDIVLLHDNHPYAAEVLPEVIREARTRGLKFATLEPARWAERSSPRKKRMLLSQWR